MSKLFKVTAVTGAVVVALYAGIGYLGVPYAVKTGIERIGSDQLKQPVTLEHVSFNPWTWDLTIQGLTIGQKAQPLLALNRFNVDVSSRSITKMAPVIESLTVDGLNVHVNLDDKTLFANDTKAKAPSQEPAKKADSGLPKFAVYNIAVKNSSLSVDSAKDNIHTNVSDITLALPFVSTLPGAQESLVTPALSMKINGTPIFAKGNTKPFGSTLEATLTTEIKNLDLVPFAAMVPNLKAMGLTMTSGTLSTDTTLVFRNPEGQNPGKMIISGVSTLKNVSVANQKGELAGFNTLRVNVGQLDAIGHHANIKEILLDNPRVQLTHTKHGIDGLKGINPHQAASKSQSSSTGSSSSAAGPAWDWSLGKVTLTNGYLNWNDQSLKAPARIVVKNLNANVAGLDSQGKEPGSFDLSLGTLGGQLSASGTVGLKDMVVEAQANAKSLNLDYVAPYLQEFMGIKLKATTGFAVKVQSAQNQVKASGTVAVDRFALGNAVRFNHFDVNLDSLDTAKQVANIRSVTLNQADIDLILTKTGTNIGDMFGVKSEAKDTKAAKDAKPAEKTGPAWAWSVGQVNLTNSAFRFEDSTKPRKPSVRLTNINARVDHLSSRPKTVSNVALSANLGKGVISDKGKFSLDPLGLEMDVTLNQVPLKSISNLMLDYAGIGAGSGLLNIDGNVRLIPGKDKPSIDWVGNANLKDFDLLGGNGKSLIVWKNAQLSGMAVHTAKPVSFEIQEAVLDSIGTKSTNQIKKASKALGFLAAALGEEKVAKDINRVNETLDKRIVLKNVAFKNGELTANGFSSNSLVGALLSKIGGELGKVLK